MVKLVINAAGTMLAIAQSRLRPIKLVAWRFHSFLISPITDQPEDAAPYHNESPCVQSMCLFPGEPLFTFTRYGANVTQTTYFRPIEKESTRSAPGTCFLLSWRRTRTVSGFLKTSRSNGEPISILSRDFKLHLSLALYNISSRCSTTCGNLLLIYYV